MVIDESHNFRNGGKVTASEDDEDPKENRYLRLMNKVIKAGVKTKVLMLSATPVNNRFNDLKNQLQLAYEGDASKINSLLKTEKPIDEIFRQAQRAYNEWIDLPLEARTTEKLLKSLSFDFFEVLDSVTIARSRKHIEQFYDTADIGKFPTRLKPISKTPPLTDIDKAITFRDIIEIVQQLNLSIYTPSAFILASKKDKYGIDTEDELDAETGSHRLSIEDRELGIRRLMGINMLKRLESSVNSFRLTISRIQQLIANMIDKIDSRSEDEYVEEFDF